MQSKSLCLVLASELILTPDDMAVRKQMNAEAVLPNLSGMGSDESKQDTENENWPGRGKNCLSPEIALQTSYQLRIEDGKSV